MVDFIDFDLAKVQRLTRVTVAKAQCVCDENGEPWDQTSFATLPDLIFWTRQALAVVVGLICGAIPVTGWFGLLVWGALVLVPTVAYTQVFLDVDWAPADAEKDDGVSFGWGKLAQEGGFPAFGTFLLVWVLTFNAMHPNMQMSA